MLVPVVCGAAVGAAVWFGLRWALPARPELAAAIEDLRRPRPLASTAAVLAEHERASAPLDRLGRRLVAFASASGLDMERSRSQDLALVDSGIERHLVVKGLTALFGLVLPLVTYLGVLAAGASLPLAVVLIGCPACMVGGFVVPDLALRSQVAACRTSFRYALGSYLDLVTVLLAGGAGTETALADAADAGDGWAYQRIRQALSSARLTGAPPWDAFDDLGAQVGVVELGELSASVSLAARQGARVRDSLTAKAASMRDHEIHEAEAAAEAATERMAMPLVLLLLGFVILIGYPAIDRVVSSL
ncbi:MAG: type II secretion system F family protein [Acidimicrobiia bacterium]